jgi:fructose-specific component phosphotransferase system IIB-like protein
MMTVDSLLANLETYVGKEVKVCGKCIHVCEHSGKNIFLANPEDDEIMIVGKAGEGIEAFNKALNGKHIYLIGTLKSVEVEGDEAEVHHDCM